MSVEDKIKDLINKKFDNVKNFAIKSNIPYTTLDSILKRGIQNTNARRIYNICKALNLDFYSVMEDRLAEYVPPLDKLTPEEAKFVQKYREADPKIKKLIEYILITLAEASCPPPEIKYKSFPLYIMPVSASTGQGISDYAEEIRIPESDITKLADFALRVRGDSMEPAFSDDDIVLVHSQPAVDVGQIGVFFLNGESFIKELGINSLLSKNSRYEPILIKETDNFRTKGLVVGKAKDYIL